MGKLLYVLGFIIMYGTVGAAESTAMSFAQILIQLLIAIAVLVVGYLLTQLADNKEHKIKNKKVFRKFKKVG